jgi:hypothetical protein
MRNQDLDDALIRRRGEMIEAEKEGELIALDVERGTCYGFNRTATRIWQLLDEPRTLAALRDLLVEEYDVEPQACERDLIEAIEQMCSDGILETTAPLRPA